MLWSIDDKKSITKFSYCFFSCSILIFRERHAQAHPRAKKSHIVNYMRMKELVFATSAPNKYHEVVKLLSEHATILQMQLLDDLQLSVPSFQYLFLFMIVTFFYINVC